MSGSSKENPTILLGSGAWHTEFHIQPVIPHFEKLGYHVVPCPLYTSGVKDPKPTFQDDVDHIVKPVKAEIDAGRSVCLISHSTAANRGCEALNQFFASATPEQKARIVHFVFVAAFLNNTRHLNDSFESGWLEVDFDAGFSYCKDPGRVFYNDMSLEDSKPFRDALQAQNLSALPDFTLNEGWRQAPATYLLCKEDKALDEKYQRMEAEENAMRCQLWR